MRIAWKGEFGNCAEIDDGILAIIGLRHQPAPTGAEDRGGACHALVALDERVILVEGLHGTAAPWSPWDSDRILRTEAALIIVDHQDICRSLIAGQLTSFL